VTIDDIVRLKARNFAQLSTMPEIDAGISPTTWQRGGYPAAIARQIGVVHDGIDTVFCAPDARATFVLPNGTRVSSGDPIVTFAARDLEPYRGFPQFMRAAALVARRDPRVIFIVAGGDGAGYGAMPEDGRPWREVMMEETGLDPSRIHFVGTLPHPDLIRLFQVSAAHVYLTYPFVLSWSMLEAMAAGVLLVASDTAPVTEFVTHGQNGLLTPFFDPDRLAAIIAAALAGGDKATTSLREAARRTVLERVGLPEMLKLQVRLLGRLMKSGT
jgi:glycosyltransferase involved in cell wall biosynthesis